jgi:hypothetical protein
MQTLFFQGCCFLVVAKLLVEQRTRSLNKTLHDCSCGLWPYSKLAVTEQTLLFLVVEVPDSSSNAISQSVQERLECTTYLVAVKLN